MSSARSVTVELQGKLEGLQDPTSDGSAYLQHLLVKSSNVFFTDINLYGLDGALIATSRPQVFDTGLLGRRMHSAAFAACGTHARSEFLHDEHIGLARYRSAYLPLRDASGRSLAYVNLPSFSRQGELDRERGALFTAIVNLFVLLFALSLLAGIFISGWTTRPLGMLQRGLSRIALQGANQPIAYHGHDEVGELVKVYNRKVEELRASAEKLARSERESAWREMARQVAHEIKNPLTPMKLGIQHFQKTWDPGGPDAKAKLDRFTHSMVEQIDALSRVAGDFSRFAQMSAANEMELDLNEVVQSAVALFTGEPNAHIVLTTSATLRVKADREHLLRVFNNLIKNAVQAIPEGRHGRVDVRLRREGDLAIAEVQDNGSGIPEHLRERIFEPSFTTKGSGMGLGLAMVKRLVEQAGGSVSFASLENEGTTFTVSLPLRN
jgi:nitrogen fixation/metabolism regulation signal transduction histidine kinase